LWGGGAFAGFTTIGSGSDTVGYWLGGLATNRLVVAPKSTETSRAWGSVGTVRGTSTTDGVANTTTLFGFGSAAHPAAYYCRALTTGGYNTWYLPAKTELLTLYSNQSATPFATANSFIAGYYGFWSSSESSDANAWVHKFSTNAVSGYNKNTGSYIRAVRRSTI
jgi:hypothetical protein